MSKRLITIRAVSQRYHRTIHTIDRWIKQGILPAPVRLTEKGPRYLDEDELEERERVAIARLRPTTAPAGQPAGVGIAAEAL
jgi:predicted DNA-binding transcriptional regulator AlpA